jgi:hypothetical protein
LRLALGLALGTKVTFAAPAVIIVCGAALIAPARRRLRTLLSVGLPCLLTGGWWYLRAALDTGSPLGLAVHIGPIALPGPNSPLANAATQTVISALGKPHAWGSRLAPGLNYALGPLWPALVVGAVVGLVAAVLVRRGPVALRAVAVAGIVAGLAYLVFPTGASEIEQQTQLFAVNLRYATPAIAIGLLLGVVLIAERAPQLLTAVALLLLVVLLATQLEKQLWPLQTTRHAAFFVAALVIVGVIGAIRQLRSGSTALRTCLTLGGVLCVLAGFVVSRHYFARRYLSSAGAATPLGQIYRWAQGISDTRLALYGTVEQYPLYGARDTNRVDYLGQPAPDGGYAPITTCNAWRTTLHHGGFQYLVLTPAPTTAAPPVWTVGDAAATPVLQPAPGYTIYQLNRSVAPNLC